MIGLFPRKNPVSGNFDIAPLTPEQRARLSPVGPLIGGGAGSIGGDHNLITIGGRTVRIVIPPGGFAGMAQQTPAVQQQFAQAAGRRGGMTTQRRRRRKAASSSTVRTRTKRRRTTRRARGRAHLVKGSAAAKRYMARIRRKRRR